MTDTLSTAIVLKPCFNPGVGGALQALLEVLLCRGDGDPLRSAEEHCHHWSPKMKPPPVTFPMAFLVAAVTSKTGHMWRVCHLPDQLGG